VVDDATPENSIDVLDHGFVRLDGALADDLSVANAARVSFARRKLELDESDEGLIRFLMRDRHGTPFEHNAFRFHIKCPIFVAREWFRHRIGCLTGDTEVTFVDINGHVHMRKTVEELWTMWHVGERDGHAIAADCRDEVTALADSGRSQRAIAGELSIGRRGVRTCLAGRGDYRDARWRVRRMRVRALNEDTNEFGVAHISDVIDKGVQPVYRLTLADGKEITLTENHRMLTDDGWLTMREAVGLHGDGESAAATKECRVAVNGVPSYQDPVWLAARRSEGLSVAEISAEAGCSYHTVRKWLARHGLSFRNDERRGRTPWNKGLKGYRTSLKHSSAHLAAIRAARSGSASNFWRDGVSSDRAANMARFADSVGHVRDVDVPVRTGQRLSGHYVDVISVHYVGVRQTYDLSIDGPWHNFVANGIVVHNSFNEFSMRYAKATDEFYVPSPGDIRSQVGKPGAYTFETVDVELAERARGEIEAVYEQAYGAYERLVEAGVARELARAVMPVGAYTQFYWTVNARALMNFVSLRAAETAQLEIRRYADAVEMFFADKMPVTHAAFVANDRTAP
jgi:thymidylate synthase (FAD)